MDILYWFFFCALGAIFGSFSTVLIHRIKIKKSGIIAGRSECPQCHHVLHWYELIPIISYLLQGGRCRHCKKHIPIRYLGTEIFMGILFPVMAYVAGTFGYIPTDIQFWIFIIYGFITGVYMLYDLEHQEIPDVIMVFGYGVIFVIFLMAIICPNILLFPDAPAYSTLFVYLEDHIIALWILYSFLYLQILIPGSFYLWKNHRKKEILELIVWYGIFPISVITDVIRSIFAKSQKSGKNIENTEDESADIPTWIGAGDLLIAIFIGATLGVVHGMIAFFLAYCIGSVCGIILIFFTKKPSGNKWGREMAFGPFLGIGWILALIAYFPIIDQVENFLL